MEGYLAALREHGIQPKPAWVAPGGFRLAESREAAKFLMRLRERPTAIVAGNDHSAFGVIRGCREAGFRVPEDISVVGVGNVEGDQHPNPFLTTVDWDRLEMGREAARLLLASIEGQPAAPAQVTFPPAVLIRQSTAPPAEPVNGARDYR
jgi:LacI family transcriptional regulator